MHHVRHLSPPSLAPSIFFYAFWPHADRQETQTSACCPVSLSFIHTCTHERLSCAEVHRTALSPSFPIAARAYADHPARAWKKDSAAFHRGALRTPDEVAAMTNFSPVKCEMDGLSPAAGTDGNPLAQPFWQSSRSSLPTFDVHGRGTARGRLQNPAHIDSIHRSEGSRVGQDTCRYMQAAAASSQKAVHQLLSRLQTYRSFKPFLSPPAPYRDNFFTHDRGFSSFSGPSHGRLSTATVSRDQLWQMVDGILDTSVAQLLQHNAEGHFIMTLQSALGLEAPISTAKSGTVIESRKAATPAINGGATELASEERTPAGGPRQPLPPALQKTAVMSSFAPASALANRWALDHPSATTAAVEEQHHAWATFDQQRQRTSRCFYLQAMQEQLDVLQAEQARDAADTTHSPPNRGDDSHSYLLDVHSSSDSEDAVTKAEEEKQQALWRTFQDGPVLTVGASESPRETALGVPGIVSDYLESTDLQDWLHCSWAHRTHRHESAALRIQCAYRVYRARCKVREMRYERRQAFLASLSAERKARQVWDLALQVQKDTTTTTTSGTDSTLRALQFFINKVNAVVAKHRARKQYQQKQDAEIRRYAATRIQAVYRGHRTRVFVTELRHPEIVALRKQLQQENCAKLIQTCWRRYAAQRHWRLARHAACVLQSMYRCHAARRMLAERRYQRNLEASAELTKFAVQRIERWYGSVLAARNAIGRAHVAELLVLQRVCRGYQGRHGVQEEKRLSRLRSAVRTIEQRRWRVMEAREAIERRAALSTANAAKRIASMRDDAAVTIQRAWRRRCVLHVC
ncbi:conserved hypothetical protein [Leishmania infantum JPCM5]|uniref:IQ_calmodulin-binding_motif_containing_protein_-_putative n=2 Tax=Leishmania infantum TaxID=5671 RepID=A4HXL6_LEIIN|nr:conserved hypothetical protein [Leishmania infantum JPCM5]CAM59835.1 conserved hypothetical protein [Leishmania infantum JPCM5]|eukprot:XP_001464807.1 conserved hypothetical protein [Leishmania infantum JPCM5]